MKTLMSHKVLFFLIIFFLLNSSTKANSLMQSQEEKLTLNFSSVSVRTILKLLAEFSGTNLVIDSKVKGEVTLHLKNIGWQQALDILLQTQALTKQAISNGWFVSTQQEYLQRQQALQRAQAYQQSLAPRFTQLVPIRYSQALDLAQLLKEKSTAFLSPDGGVAVEKRTNSLWLRDTKENLQQIEKIIRQLDKPIAQVAIEARIISIDHNKAQELGARFGLASSMEQAVLDTKHPIDKHITPSLLSHLSMDLPFSNHAKLARGLSMGLHLMQLSKNILLDLELSALENEGGAQIIASPHLVTADQQLAHIEAGEDIPYQGKSENGAISVVFKKAVLALNVTPRVMPNRRVLLDLEVKQDQPSNFTVLDIPAIKDRGIKTQVILNDGETIVLGGIYEQATSERVQRIPFLGSLPVIGSLFSIRANGSRRNELLIFVTPTILSV